MELHRPVLNTESRLRPPVQILLNYFSRLRENDCFCLAFRPLENWSEHLSKISFSQRSRREQFRNCTKLIKFYENLRMDSEFSTNLTRRRDENSSQKFTKQWQREKFGRDNGVALISLVSFRFVGTRTRFSSLETAADYERNAHSRPVNQRSVTTYFLSASLLYIRVTSDVIHNIVTCYDVVTLWPR